MHPTANVPTAKGWIACRIADEVVEDLLEQQQSMMKWP
jgi:hypothetical protein